MKISVALAAAAGVLAASPSLAGGRPTACYEPVRSPALYSTVAEDVLVRPASVVYDVVPARYGYATREVLVEPERVIAERIPAEYTTVARQVLLQPERVIRRAAPPVYRTVTETVLIEPARETWEWRVIGGRRVYCRIVLPARYGTRERTVVERGESWDEVIPAEYGIEHVQVMLAPERYVQHVIPARYETVREQVILEPEQTVAREIPAQYETRHRTVKVRDEAAGWRQVHLRGAC
ncbi:hypothetical protein [Aurantimonas sp. HBX-1]|uniref:hypothetical protein n=1 Tax=Aurantimonas sp. HBX-1 TaxID=2906072 RepID=UPI001F281C6C|nr:hypothetical protein [Aurantimonas sp. HBX-1]UIJ73997.1 hypothetical protein LXB15_10470 [Aurantimonas sp. HBX-1]